MKNKTLKIILAIVAAFLLLFIARACYTYFLYSNYNDLVKQEYEVMRAWEQVDNQYQRRIDLIKVIAAETKQYSKHDFQQIQDVAATADSIANVKIDRNNLQSMLAYAAAQDKMLEQARLAINVVHEAYPELKADKLFENLQTQLEGTEKRLSSAINTYDENVMNFNTTIHKFPKSFVANQFGFHDYFSFNDQQNAKY